MSGLSYSVNGGSGDGDKKIWKIPFGGEKF